MEHHVRLGVRGLFLTGSNGEGPWMTDAQRRTLVETAVRCSRGRMPVAVQVTDNSAARILDNMRQAADAVPATRNYPLTASWQMHRSRATHRAIAFSAFCGMGALPMSRRGVSPLQCFSNIHGRDARGTHGQDARATRMRMPWGHPWDA